MVRPSKYETHVAPRFEEIKDWVRNGATDEEVAKRLGVAYSTLREYKTEFSAFSAVLKETKDIVDAQVENALLQNALKGNITAQIFWLKNRRAKQWREKPVEVENNQERKLDELINALNGRGNNDEQ